MGVSWFNFRGEQNDSGEEPEDLLRRATEELKRSHAANRERAVRAITERNNCQTLVNHLSRLITELREKAAQEEACSDFDCAATTRNEIISCECALVKARADLEEAAALAEQAKEEIQREEVRVCRKVAEATVLQAEWRVLELEKTLASLLIEIQDDTSEPVNEENPTHRKSREAAIQAIAARNLLSQLLQETHETIYSLHEKAELARATRNEPFERELLREIELYEASEENTRRALVRAEQIVTQVKAILRGEISSEPVASSITEVTPAIPTAPRRNSALFLWLLFLVAVIALLLVGGNAL